ncbi:LTA synthase family protein [Christiangramia echinicola]|uniref:Uncharacterized sulfatase n=1 Tax=Christiangramia echinicola TaxID=279359 RepID=A0A1H1KWR0_9FLAO|nr:LTA synthase family protein [Christiangramia echinicola]SDR66577.1 uncharacterized sulfatase [Christiangramia echinicola]
MSLKSKSGKTGVLKKIAFSTSKFALLSFIFLGFLFVLSGVEIGLGLLNHSMESSFFSLWGWSCLEDLKFFFSFILPAYLVYLPLHLLIPRITNIIFKTGLVLFFLIQLSLVFYYNTTLLLLGSDIFGYSLEEITQTVGASGSLSFTPFLILLLFISILIFALVFLPKKIIIKREIGIVLPVTSLLFIGLGISDRLQMANMKSEFESNLIRNKFQHFYTAAYGHFNPELYEVDIYAESYLGDFNSNYSIAEPIEYLDETNYPFLRKELKRDVLTPFFETKEQAPDIVIIIVEGLGRAFTNRGAYLGNFTPFLDSLSNKSLYWPNFLSNGGRTFAVLPSLLGSMPFGENGFMDMEKNMPDELSLLNLLQENGYNTNFYYGGNSEFDKMAMYLKKNKVDRIVDENDFPGSYKKIPASASGFTWGYGDKEMFRYYFDLKKKDPKSPKLDVMLTVSMHSPFITDETEKYELLFEERLEDFGFSEEKKERYRNYQKQYSSVLFTDEALRQFFQEYKKDDKFNNTIFIITGDHRIPEIPMASKIDRYHVPLLIYSPLLKRQEEFESISSHFDVAPSLISFLKNNYALKAPESNSFIGAGLDTTRSFQNIHNIPLKQTKTELIDFVMGEYHLNGDNLYRLTRDFKEEPVQDEAKKDELRNAFNQFKRKNAEVIEGKKILPDSLIRKYSQ